MSKVAWTDVCCPFEEGGLGLGDVHEFMRMVIRNGQPVSSWLDLWHPAGRLIDLTREIGTQKLGIAMKARICDIFVNNWRIRVCLGRQLQRLLQEIHRFPLLLTVNVPNGILWKNGPGDYGGKFI
ncbi:unnamed protein product, partial [Brassica rapa]